ncbi:hypothetical protein Gohar_009560, partial [Gossypium harknessii]|nr:hypothetical protein [Gossypium harknessii]
DEKSTLTTESKSSNPETATAENKTSSTGASQPAQAGASPTTMPGFVPPNPFDFSAMSGLLNVSFSLFLFQFLFA